MEAAITTMIKMEKTVTLPGSLFDQELRSQQMEAIQHVRESTAKYMFLNAPTGCGKSIIGLQSFDVPIYYLCSSKRLQEQILKDFSEVVTLKGAGNYQCKKGSTCNNCFYVAHRQRRKCVDCEYLQAIAQARRTKIAVLNYHVFIYMMNFTHNLNERLVIVDEADLLENILVDFLSFDIKYDQFMRYRLSPVQHVRKIDEFWDWQEEALEVFQNHYEKSEDAKEIDMLKVIIKKLQRIKKYQDYEYWFFRNDAEQQKMMIRPMWLTKELSHEIFFKFGSKFLMMSGTLPAESIVTQLLGIDENYDYFEVKSDFPIQNRKVHVVGNIDMSWKNRRINEGILQQKVEEIINKNQNKRGMILVSSYDLLNQIKQYSTRITDNYEIFKIVSDSVLISAADWRGLDLKDDLCRFIIIAKIPYASLGDFLIKSKVHSRGSFGQMWYISDAITKMVQGYGRGCRHRDDYCETYIIDSSINDVIRKHKKLCPSYFLEACYF